MHRRESLRALLALPAAAHRGPGSQPRGARTALDWVDVRATGAAGTGTSDDSAAIQRALEQVRAGGTVYVPPGRYRIEHTLSPRFTSRFQNGVQVQLCLDPGAILIGAIADRRAAVIDCRESVGQEGWFRIDGGIIEGVKGHAGTGIRIATCNITVEGTGVRRFDAAGVDFADGGDAPAIRANFHRVALLSNGVGFRCEVDTASGLVMDRSWIEGSSEEGMIIHGAGHVSIIGTVIETNGIERRDAPQLVIRGRQTTSVHVLNSYFEGAMTQANAQVVVEGVEAAVRNFVFTANRVVGSSLPGSHGITIGEHGVVDMAVVMGNTFVGSRVGVSIGRFTRDYHVFGNAWSDSFSQPTAQRVRVDARRSELVRVNGIGDVNARASSRRNTRHLKASAPVVTDDDILLCDAARHPITITLEPAAASAGTLVVKKTDLSANAVRIAAQPGERIDGAATLALTSPNATATLHSDGTAWWRIG